MGRHSIKGRPAVKTGKKQNSGASIHVVFVLPEWGVLRLRLFLWSGEKSAKHVAIMYTEREDGWLC